MQVRMKAAEILNPDKINQFLKLGDTIEFAGQAAPKGTRLRSNCWRRKSMLDKARSSVARSVPYLSRMTGLSLPQTARLIQMYIETGTIEPRGYRRHQFANKYTDGDVDLPGMGPVSPARIRSA
jgi:hypothetical protein